MCGIGGFLGRFDESLLDRFVKNLAHRGPDGFGAWHDGQAGIGLAHRRLSIIDLSAAADQPMAGVGGRYAIAFNGEIYNFRTLHAQLGDYDINRNSDTAVLAPLYDRFGPAMLERLQGMFAFALWDARERELFIARDHAGIKPLYYARTARGLLFASELKALANIDGVDMSADAAALADYLTLLWSPGERTPARGIRKLLPGHWLRARLRDGHVEIDIERWYAPPQAPLTRPSPPYDDTLTPDGLRELLDTVVADQCTSDVPVGAFLSGGVDSSALVAGMVANARAGLGPAPAQTYCIGFADAGLSAEGFSDDLDYAKTVAAHLGVPFTPMIVEQSAILERLPGLAAMLDEPTADPAPLFVEDICRRARADGIKVLLSGTGGDDVMTGYRRHLTGRLRQKLGPLAPGAGTLLALAAPVLGGARSRRAGQLAGLLAGSDDEFLSRAFMTNSRPDAWKLLAPDLRAQLGSRSPNALQMAVEESRGQDLVDRLLRLELAGFLPDHNLNYGDKASMASGVEVRVPFTDRRVIAFMSGVDPVRKLRGTQLKAFFKDAMATRLPQGVIHRSKTGFGAPIRVWLTGPGREFVRHALFARADSWFDRSGVERLWRDTQAGRVDGAYTILALCMCEWWRNSFERPITAATIGTRLSA